ncbi:MAG: NUDIX domain-containing protein [Mycoplasmatota bacterium]
MKTEKSCGTFIVDGQKVLIIKQKRLGDYGFPKGHMEAGESEMQTALRETKEETNVDVEIISDKRYLISYPKDDGILKEVVYFFAKAVNKDFLKMQEKEISEILWVDVEEVEKILSYENIKGLWLSAKKDLIDIMKK